MKTLRFLFFLAVLTTAVIAESKDIKTFSIYETSCNGERESIGIDKMPISFSWKTASEKRGFIQSAYRILVADSREKLDADNGNVWDSGKRRTRESVMVKYEGAPLKSSTRYYWKVKIWDENRKASEWSQTESFVTGMFS